MKISSDTKFIVKLGLTLFLICAVCVCVLSLCNSLTIEKIEQLNIEKAENAKINVLSDAESFEDGDKNDEYEIYIGKKGDEKVGYAVKVSPSGYGGKIEMMVGVDSSFNITGVTIVNMSETPGLGAKASDDKFIGQFKGLKALESSISVIKSGTPNGNEVVAISGATVTSKAVASGVNTAITAIKDMEGIQ